MRVDRCDWSGFKVYPSRGKVYVRGDSKVRIDHEVKGLVEIALSTFGKRARHGQAMARGTKKRRLSRGEESDMEENLSGCADVRPGGEI